MIASINGPSPLHSLTRRQLSLIIHYDYQQVDSVFHVFPTLVDGGNGLGP